MQYIDLMESSFKLNIISLKILGLYPYESFPKIYTIYAYIFYTIFTVPTPTLYFINLFIVSTSMTEISNGAFIMLQIGILIVKLLPFKNHPHKVQNTMHSLRKKIFNNYLEEQKPIIDDCVKTCKMVYYIFTAFCSGSIFTWPLRAFLTEKRSLPAAIWLPFDPFENNMVYWALFLLEVLGVANAGYGNAALDTLIAGLTCHAAAQLKIMKDTLQNLSRRVDEEISRKPKMSDGDREKLKSKIIYKKICDCVDHYNAVFEFVSDLEDTYSFVVFSQFIASIIVISISCLQLSIVEPFTIVFYAMVIWTATMFSEIYFYCYYGTVLYQESDTIVTAIYMSEWYNYDPKCKQALLILMERAKRPMKVTSGKILDLSLETFTMMIRRSYSLLAILKNF